ncbi:filamentous hemagglutinin N-terminal domain-containing protein [Desulfococcaceae bacterium HSG8]|nr:filamentous hemagglutinin N-terminal domain-containing protein [Desulfococcaceae bacterium HSG8]
MRKFFPQLIIAVTLMAGAFNYVSPAHAQLTLDGSMGTDGSIKGPVYDIKAIYGQQAGANLFHSFSQFNIHTSEIADFRVSPSVENIISRVTGGSSWIDGTIRSTISGTSEISAANLYLLNPSGVMFGENASLNLGGSFHISTADYLRLGENDRFYTEPVTGETLSTASPSAFGFLDDDAGRISFEGGIKQSKEDENFSGLRVSEDKTLSVIGGDIEMKGIYYEYPGDQENRKPLGNLSVAGGQIHLVSLASSGEVIPTASGPDVSSFEEMGTITLSDYALIQTSGEGSGDIFVRGNSFFADKSSVKAHTNGDKDGGITDIQTDTLSLRSSSISSDTEGKGRGGDISLRISESLDISDFSSIFANAEGEGADAGDGGNILIETKDLLLSGGSIISADTYYGGASGGDIRISGPDNEFADSIRVSGAKIYSRAVYGGCSYAGDGGFLELKAEDISFTDGGIIGSDTGGKGRGGDITIHASDSVLFQGADSKAYACTFSKLSCAGDGGDILIKAGSLSRKDGGDFETCTYGPGKPGTITLEITPKELPEPYYPEPKAHPEPLLPDMDAFTIPKRDEDRRTWMTLCPEPGKTFYFIIKGRDSVPTPFNAWFPSPSFRFGSLEPDHNPSRKGYLESSDLFEESDCEECGD